MTDEDKRLDDMEERVPALADEVFAQACRAALAAGLSVMQCVDDTLYEIFPDGTRKVVKKIEPPTRVPLGAKFELR